MNPILIVVFLAILGVLGDFFLKLSGSGTKYIDVRWFVIGFLVYAVTIVGWFYVMKHIKLSTIGVIYSLTTVLFLVLVGVFYFHEKMNVYEIIGVVMALASLSLLTRFA